jgi:hypothetical protein
VLGVEAPPEVMAALDPHRDFLAQEVLAVEVRLGSVDGPVGVADVMLDGSPIRVSLRRAV